MASTTAKLLQLERFLMRFLERFTLATKLTVGFACMVLVVLVTGGYSLYEAKREQHGNVHAFPSSVDREHLAQARTMTDGDEPADVVHVPGMLDLSALWQLYSATDRPGD